MIPLRFHSPLIRMNNISGREFRSIVTTSEKASEADVDPWMRKGRRKNISKSQSFFSLSAMMISWILKDVLEQLELKNSSKTDGKNSKCIDFHARVHMTIVRPAFHSLGGDAKSWHTFSQFNFSIFRFALPCSAAKRFWERFCCSTLLNISRIKLFFHLFWITDCGREQSNWNPVEEDCGRN